MKFSGTEKGFIIRIYAASGSGLAKAVTYSINHKAYLNNVLLSGDLELTHNLAERAIEPFVIGRKNWLFSDADKGVVGYLSFLLNELPKLGENPTEIQCSKEAS